MTAQDKQLNTSNDALDAAKRRILDIGRSISGQELLIGGSDPTSILVSSITPGTPPIPDGISMDPVTISHLQWMVQKDTLGQDIFLLGPPGPYKYRLLMLYLHLTRREYEYIPLTKDTTEGNIKQRRELVGKQKSIKWVDGAAVSAVLHNKVLILDGIEKAEKNVLTMLNNLLENREMNLEDGRRIISASRYKNLLKEFGHDKVVNEWKFISAGENFRVIGLSVPNPPYNGNPLDPPFRSRFQVRYVPNNYLSSLMSTELSTKVESDVKLYDLLLKTKNLIQTLELLNDPQTLEQQQIQETFLGTNNESSNKGLLLPMAPSSSLERIYHLWKAFPAEMNSVESSLMRYWPQSCVSSSADKGNSVIEHLHGSKLDLLRTLLSKFDFKESNFGFGESNVRFSEYSWDTNVEEKSDGTGIVNFIHNESNTKVSFPIPRTKSNRLVIPFTIKDSKGNSILEKNINESGKYEITKVLMTDRLKDVSTRLVQHLILNQPVCLVGAKGGGKTTVINMVTSILKVPCDTMYLYRDMTSRDLLQRRSTNEIGETIWEPSILLEAAIKGHTIVLDGLQWLNSGTLSSLQRLIYDLEIKLPDGKLLSWRANKDSIPNSIQIHKNFRIICTSQNGKSDWLNHEISGMFSFLGVELFDENEILSTISGLKGPLLDKFLKFKDKFRSLEVHNSKSLTKGISLTTRQLQRIANILVQFPNSSNLYSLITQSCLSAFLPTASKSSLHQMLIDSGIQPAPGYPSIIQHESNLPLALQKQRNANKKTLENLKIEKTSTSLTIGNLTLPVRPDDHLRGLVPDSIGQGGFYDNQVHTRLMRDLLMDFMTKQHILLVGNQGVGKNKITDRLLDLMNIPREYIQLHRDSTVQNLLVRPIIENGELHYADSPLVKACKEGLVLIVDEADKAPIFITSVLKSLVEVGELQLTDGRWISRSPDADIPLHPNFQMIVLANRPKFPFLGNDFYKSVGDVFSCHAVENPDSQSEIELLVQAAPNVDVGLIRRLTGLFSVLREKFDDGVINYPYSLRELLNLVRHLNKYPNTSVQVSLRNVFDFDLHRADFRKVLLDALKMNSIPTDGLDMAYDTSVSDEISKNYNAAMVEYKSHMDAYKSPADVIDPKDGKVDPKNEPHVGGNTWKGGTGGSSTAGLGGRGGAYRQDNGHPVFKLGDAIKEMVPEEVKEAAKKMGQEALKKKLEEIQMSSFEADVYNGIYGRIINHVNQLKSIMDSVQPKEKEREWATGQQEGDWDESKVVESLAGETDVFKRRVSNDDLNNRNSGQKRPKRIRFVFDISGSMYHFNGQDGRLNRSLETAMMIMESLSGLGDKYAYDIAGHSGDSEYIPLVKLGESPKNELERLKILQTMTAHSQYCMSGDNTLQATKRGIKDVLQYEDADDYILIILSDANLKRYGISPKEMANVMESDERVNVAVIFIGTLWNEAKELTSEIPAGKGFVALNTEEIPRIMKDIFEAFIEE